MMFSRLVLSLAILGSVTTAAAAQRAFRIYEIKQITPQVDRYYGRDGGAFGTLFCREDAAEIMFVDSRFPELDGKSFFFASPQACVEAKNQARKSYQKCATSLVLDTGSQTASVQSSGCLF